VKRFYLPLKYLLWSVILLLGMVACQEETVTPPTLTLEPTNTVTSPPRATTASPTVVGREQATIDSPTVPPAPSETPIPYTPTPTIPPAEHLDVSQQPYAASECSDKYPCNDDFEAWVERVKVPPGFEARIYASIDDNPTSLAFSADGFLFVAGHSGVIYEVGRDGQAMPYVDGLTVPTGIAFQPGTDRLFISSRITDTNTDGEGKVSVVEDGIISTLFDGLPCCYIGMHGPNGIAFGPDGYGYVGVGGRADHGERLLPPALGEQDAQHPFEASILRFDPESGQIELYAHGFRNPYDIAWDTEGHLFATDNGRDPDFETGFEAPDELHLVVPGGEHGYPYYDCTHCFGIPEGVEIIPPILDILPHSAVTGITAYNYPSRSGYYNDLFLVAWSAFEGAQKVIRYSPDSGESSDFATGFAQPIDIAMGPDGFLYVADYATGLIFQLVFPE